MDEQKVEEFNVAIKDDTIKARPEMPQVDNSERKDEDG